MSAMVISAFPGCGKSTFYKNNSCYANENNKSKILDSDSSLFSWIYDEEGNKTDQRDPSFPSNYINHIKDNLDKADIIFVSSHKVVRDELEKAGINYVLIYPHKSLKNEWLIRFKERGNDDKFIQFQDQHWNEFIDDMSKETFPTLVELQPGESHYIDDDLMGRIYQNKFIDDLVKDIH